MKVLFTKHVTDKLPEFQILYSELREFIDLLENTKSIEDLIKNKNIQKTFDDKFTFKTAGGLRVVFIITPDQENKNTVLIVTLYRKD